MVFSSAVFLFVFLPVTLAGYYLAPVRFRNAFLLTMSLLFYAYGEPRFVFVMMASILINHLFALRIGLHLERAQAPKGSAKGGASRTREERKKAKILLILSILFNLSLFFVYKYLDFTIRNLNGILTPLGMGPLQERHIPLPIGISFFTFQAMSYVFDVYYRRASTQRNPLNTALYISLFPQLIAGPIVRYETVAKEIGDRKATLDDFSEGVRRFACGLAKKAILANGLATIADNMFDNVANFSTICVVDAWIGAVVYALQLYYDFSGYSDMAIGLGRMFGFHFDENFNYPYISRTVAEFWQRWHISLGAWFRDYVFYPISVSEPMRRMNGFIRKRAGRRLARLFMMTVPTGIVWFLTGLWHGASWTFVAWGCYYGFLLVLSLVFEPLTRKWTKSLHLNVKSKGFAAFQILRTVLIVLIAAVLFRSAGLRGAARYYACMFGLAGNALADKGLLFWLGQNLPFILIAILFCTPVYPAARARLRALNGRKAVLADAIDVAAHLGLLILGVSFVVTSTYNPFIYFNF